MIRLSEGEVGKKYSVSKIDCNGQSKRLNDLGIIPGAIAIVRSSSKKKQMIIDLGESRYALGRSLTNSIYVEQIEEITLSHQEQS